MAGAALTARLRFLGAGLSREATAGDAFNELGGPVVAICGLTGGAGSTTLALLLAQSAAEASSAPVLITESCAGGGLARLAGRATPHSLETLASRASQGDAPSGAFAELTPGLRLVATADRSACDPRAPVAALVKQAREAHGLVVIDCGSAWSADNPLIVGATNRVWAFPATPAGVAAARAALPADAGIAVAVARDSHATVPVRVVRRAVRGRCRRLVLVPYSERLARSDLSADDSTAHAITAIATSIRGTR